jgi:TolB-like protein
MISKRKSIAVLPFINMSADQAADSITEDILMNYRASGTFVLARNSSFQFPRQSVVGEASAGISSGAHS